MKGNFQNKLIKSLLVLAVTFGIFSLSHVTTYAEAAIAETDTTATVGSYTIKVPAGAEIPTADGSTTVTEITSSTTSLGEGWYVVKDNITIDQGVTFDGAVNIILCDGKTLTVKTLTKNGSSSSTCSITIWGQNSGTGALNASSTETDSIAISAHNVTVNGGRITAIAVHSGIYAYNSLTINAGTIEANGTGEYDTGIFAVAFTVNGGKIIAKGGQYGINAPGNFIVNAGTIEASGTGTSSAGIDASTFTINNGKITAKGGLHGINAPGNFIVNAGTIEASGTGTNSDGIDAPTFTMNNSKITARGVRYGINAPGQFIVNAGAIEAYGTGTNGEGIEAPTFTINNGKITAKGGQYGISAPGSFTVNDGTIKAEATGTGTNSYGINTSTFTMNDGVLEAIGATNSIVAYLKITIADSAKIYTGDVAPGTLFEGSDYMALENYKYAKIQLREDAPQQDTTSSTTAVEAPSTPAMQSASINGTKLDSWDAVSNAIKSVKAAELNKVADASDSMLQLNIVGTTDKIVPVAVVKALNQANFKFFHIFVGEGDAVTFDTAADNSNYTGISFAHKDTVTETSRTIDFTSKGAIGLNVLFHTTVPKNNATVNIYRMEDGNKVLIATTVSNANGQLCFAIDQTAEYILEY